jgi:hypothetical protein
MTNTIDYVVLRRAYRIAERAQAMLNRPNVSQATRDRAGELLRDARNLTARAYGMPETF